MQLDAARSERSESLTFRSSRAENVFGTFQEYQHLSNMQVFTLKSNKDTNYSLVIKHGWLILYLCSMFSIRPLLKKWWSHGRPLLWPPRKSWNRLQKEPSFHRFFHHLFHGHVFDGDLRDFRDVLLESQGPRTAERNGDEKCSNMGNSWGNVCWGGKLQIGWTWKTSMKAFFWWKAALSFGSFFWSFGVFNWNQRLWLNRCGRLLVVLSIFHGSSSHVSCLSPYVCCIVLSYLWWNLYSLLDQRKEWMIGPSNGRSHRTKASTSTYPVKWIAVLISSHYHPMK